ncbi:ribosome small subunit-dependent GTPase A [Pseudoteredinibacter isoporae]|uniref:Small ribosomal subunit biogenesis GTPase RsgA n=1 Tax=Pseudoteredinibacter isoporae TaxID=570281 RepID=A0A7X0JR43_9GAMM|nr:ribosome small subunit-dependent GTPase A [Pseudoteredinibacter isoporae]MBB6520767.1 ribosome biogenesis GTPase [Pseudoteredinibacter isoporae]NHO86333.1 ribosome small subunit-dependent GTPase A [Pseudoteredinibacter isoporae]NIB25215.1 ribosome small subunit-dependent GTPase A [Pseudoteredinibacter isoporae]
MTTRFSLSQWGWSPFFQQQLTLAESSDYLAARVIAQHRSYLELITELGQRKLTLTNAMPTLAVGDWLLLYEDGRFYRALDRLSLFSRKSAGSKLSEQLIAVNVDTVFITSAMNRDFSLNRIERYLALTKEAGAEAVVVLTKSDLCENPEQYVTQAQTLDPFLVVEPVNALDFSRVKSLMPWCKSGNTVAILGSSGVGKSTLVNTLLGQSTQQTGSARDDDDKGRHTTTSRSLHPMPNGGVLLDTPGMRELQLANCESGVQETFSDISTLAEQCRYKDCQHESEPGCAVQQAIENGSLDSRRLESYLKLMREQAHNGASLAERRARDRSLSRYYRSVLNESNKFKKGR